MRTTRKLLTHYDIHTPLTSFHDIAAPLSTLASSSAWQRSTSRWSLMRGCPRCPIQAIPQSAAALARGRAGNHCAGSQCRDLRARPVGLADPRVPLSRLPATQAGGAPPSGRKRVAAEDDTLLMYELPHRLLGALTDIEAGAAHGRGAFLRVS